MRTYSKHFISIHVCINLAFVFDIQLVYEYQEDFFAERTYFFELITKVGHICTGNTISTAWA